MNLETLYAVYFFIFGLVFGSFLNVCIARIPEGESIVAPRSKCPGCQSAIAFYDNIPLLSFLLLRGKCRHCHAKISWLYPSVEFLTGLLAYFCFIKLRLPLPSLLWFLFFISPLIVISVIDLKHYLIPDILSLPSIALGFLLHAYSNGSLHWKEALLDSFLGALLGAGILFLIAFLYEYLRKQEGLGGGDVKLAAMLGAFLGWKSIFFIFFYASLTASLLGLSLILINKFRFQSKLPFGPFLSFGAILYFFKGSQFLFHFIRFLHPMR
ncbi:MAG: prepilin peptidase [Deltaproteobacteria bacterium]|nr:prepilin peptidase [Deltaproteobacteria bacterium]